MSWNDELGLALETFFGMMRTLSGMISLDPIQVRSCSNYTILLSSMRAIECTSFRGDRNTWLRVGFFRGWTQGPAIARIAAFYLTFNKRLVGSEMSTIVCIDVQSLNPFPKLLEADDVRHQGHPTVIG